jgi:hypothetical protein
LQVLAAHGADFLSVSPSPSSPPPAVPAGAGQPASVPWALAGRRDCSPVTPRRSAWLSRWKVTHRIVAKACRARAGDEGSYPIRTTAYRPMLTLRFKASDEVGGQPLGRKGIQPPPPEPDRHVFVHPALQTQDLHWCYGPTRYARSASRRPSYSPRWILRWHSRQTGTCFRFWSRISQANPPTGLPPTLRMWRT